MLAWIVQLGYTAGAAALVEVPDVVGQSQASGTAEIEGAGLVVAVQTAYSSVVPAGDIISQDPTAGAMVSAGSTITIVVSLGEAPAPPPQASGGGGFYFGFDRYRHERERERRRRREREEEAERIEDETTREIARLLRVQEAKDAERAELERLQSLADRFATAPLGLPSRVRAALYDAQEERTRNALLKMQREIERMLEEEEAMVMALLNLDD